MKFLVLELLERLVFARLTNSVAHCAPVGLTIELFDLYCLRAPGTNDLEFHVKAPFKKEKGDRALMIELRPPYVAIRVTVCAKRSVNTQTVE